jgi:hypothetical protein
MVHSQLLPDGRRRIRPFIDDDDRDSAPRPVATRGGTDAVEVILAAESEVR